MPARRPTRFREVQPYATADTFGCSIVAEATQGYAGDLRDHARTVDRELRQLVGEDNTCRRVLGLLAGRFLSLRGHERFGFARFADYCSERLGWSGRQIQEIARVIAALSRLPLTELAFRRGTIGWSKARLLVSVATPADESKWIAIASTTDARTLATVTASARAAAREQRPLPADGFDTEDEEEERALVRIECSKRARFLWNEARRLAPRMAGRALAQWEVAEMVAAEASSAPGPFADRWQQEPWRGFAAGRPDPTTFDRKAAADAHCDRTCGSSASDAECDRTMPPAQHDAPSTAEHDARRHRASRAQSHHRPPGPSAFETEPAPEPCLDAGKPEQAEPPAGATPLHVEPADRSDFDEVISPIEQELERLAERNVFELDAAMRRVRTAMQNRQARLGATLGLFLELRLHDQLGHSCGTDYVRERLGLPDRTARDLVRVAQAAQRSSPLLASAYERGELSWLRVLALLSVVRPWNVAAWIQRAGEVTLRRLNDEVAWTLAQADLASSSIANMPPAVGSDLGLRDGHRRMCAHGAPGEATPSDSASTDNGHRRMCAHGAPGEATSSDSASTDNGDRRMCAHGAAAQDAPARSRDEFWGLIGRIRITFLAPVSVSVAFRTVMQGFASPLEPRWLAIERMLEQVVSEWRRQPSHRDPVFERDGYRCTAPGCSSYANLHDHHIVPRSAGGSNEQSNRTTLCAWHHLRAVHGGLATATGQAPDEIDWGFGLAEGQEPLVRMRGDRYTRTSS